MPTLQLMHPQVSQALEAALEAAELRPADGAAVALGRLYARALDGPVGDVVELGPRFLALLTALGMTPAGRVALAKGRPVDPDRRESDEQDELAHIRTDRERRAAGTR